MKCIDPYRMGVFSGGCGKCPPCRINRRRLWTHRIILESFKHPENAFITLTYAPHALPGPGPTGGVLVPKHLTLFLKRLRAYFAPTLIRYFAVGEYGDKTWRPHFHLALFGVGPLRIAGASLVGEPLKSLWGMGHVFVGELNEATSQYIGGYVAKKFSKVGAPGLYGRPPEFARMSLRPGIGALAMPDVANACLTTYGSTLISENRDVPSALQHGKKLWPLGRYLRRRLRYEMGFSSMDTPKEALALSALKLSVMHKLALEDAGDTSQLPFEDQPQIKEDRAIKQRGHSKEKFFKIHESRRYL